MNASDISIDVDHVSKKFARSLKHAMWYGLVEVGQKILIPSRFRSSGYEARMRDLAAVPGAPPRPSSAVGVEALSRPPDTTGLRTSEFWALRDVSFQIKRGEAVGVVGHNGAGKSTLFSILSGIYGPTSGQVAIRGRLQALIALGAGFHPAMTGRENIYINAAILGLKVREVDRLLDKIIDFSGLKEFVDMPVKNYSSGMLVRLGFSVAAHLDPDVLLIDEVLAVGDAAFQNKCQEFSRNLASSGKTVLIVTHNMIVIQSLCQRCLWFGQGQLIEDGESQGTVRRYKEHMLDVSRRANATQMAKGLGVAILGAVIEDADGNTLSELPTRAPFRIRASLSVLQFTSSAKLWVNISDQDYDRCLVEASMLEDQCTIDLPAGDHEISVEWPAVPFNTNARYRIAVGIRDWSGQILVAESYASNPVAATASQSPALAGGDGWRNSRSMNPIIAVPYRWVSTTISVKSER